MFKQVPPQIWLLIAIGAAAYVPALYVYRHFVHSPSRRDITRPTEDLSWRTSSQLTRSLAILAALAGFAIFIFTPAASQFAHSPKFLPLLAAASGAWALVTVARGFSTGRIEPFSRGFNETYERVSQPKRFWASMTWNTLLGILCLWLAFEVNEQAIWQPLEDRCYDRNDSHSPQDELAACNELISKRGSDKDVAAFIAARGSAYYRLRDYPKAKVDYTRAVRLNPQDSSAHYNLGLVAEHFGDRERAATHYGDAIRVDPENADAYFRRGLIFLDGGKFDQALTDFTRTHELRPKDPWPLANRGMAYVWKKDKARAEQDFVTVRAVDPSNAVMLRGEALLSMMAGDRLAAVKSLTAALKSDPGNRFALRTRAAVYRELGKEKEADADLDEIWRLSMNPNDAKRGSYSDQ